MNWKLLSVPLLGLTLVACDSKKEEKKAHEATPSETLKVEEPKTAVEEPKASEAAPAEAPKEEHKEEAKDHK